MKQIVLTTIILFGLLSAVGCTQTNSAQSQPDFNRSMPETNSNSAVNVSQTDYPANNISPEISNAEVSSQAVDETVEEPGTSEAPKYAIELLMDSQYYEEEVENSVGVHRGWLGLYRKKNKYLLLPTTIEVKKVRHNLRDDKDSKEKTGRAVTSNIKLPNVFLLKNAKMLRPGEVTTVFYSDEEDSEYINRKYRRAFDFNGEKYLLFVEDSSGEDGEHLTAKSKMVVARGDVEQVIYQTDYCSDCSWNLCWVGDLDRDGKLDFMFNLNSHYNSTCHTLFLSSPAKKREIVRDVAEVCQMGC